MSATDEQLEALMRQLERLADEAGKASDDALREGNGSGWVAAQASRERALRQAALMVSALVEDGR